MSMSHNAVPRKHGRKNGFVFAALTAACLLAIIAAGCRGPSRTGVVAPISTTASLAARGYGAQPVNTTRVAALAKQCGGDWDRLSPGGKKYMLEDVTGGNVNQARAMLANAASH